MGNKKAREYLKEKELKDSWDRVIKEPRGVHGDVHIRGIGARLISLKYSPAFDEKYSWDVRRINDELEIYQSEIHFDGSQVYLLGYKKLDVGVMELRKYFELLSKATVPIAPILNNQIGLDGTEFELKLIGSLNSEIAFKWWSTWPKNWSPIVEPTFDFIELLIGKRIDRGDFA